MDETLLLVAEQLYRRPTGWVWGFHLTCLKFFYDPIGQHLLAMANQKKDDRNGGVWQSGILKSLAEYEQCRLC